MKNNKRSSFPPLASLWYGLLLPLFILLSGCSGAPVAPLQSIKADYNDTLNHWTRRLEVNKGFETVFIATGTYKGGAFMEAYSDEYGRRHSLTPGEIEVLKASALDKVEEYNEILLIFYSYDRSLNNLDDRSSPWTLTFEEGTAVGDKGESGADPAIDPPTGGEEGGRMVTAMEVVKVRDEAIPKMIGLYPMIDPWSTPYMVRFPKYTAEGRSPIPGEGVHSVTLTISGPGGEGTMTWDLR